MQGSTGVLPLAIQRMWLAEALDCLHADHDRGLQSRGQSYISRVRGLKWDAEKRQFQATVWGSQAEPYQLTVHLPQVDFEAVSNAREIYELMENYEDELWVRCSCPYSANSTPCKHTSAFVRHLIQRFQTPAYQAEILNWVFGKPVPQWQTTLKALDQFVSSVPQAVVPNGVTAVRRNRLVWRVQLINGGSGTSAINLIPHEQTLSTKSDVWLRGRKIQSYNLKTTAQIYGNAQDQEAAQAMQMQSGYGYYGRDYYNADVFGALTALAGHPLVFWDHAPERSVTIDVADVGLLLERSDDGFRLQASLNGEPPIPQTQWYSFTGKGLVVADHEQNKLTLARTKHKAEAFILQTVAAPPFIPNEGQAELFARLPALEAVLPVKWPKELMGEETEPDRRMVLRLLPGSEGGLAAQLRVRPATENEMFLPGQGLARLVRIKEGKCDSVVRDLDGESVLANQIIEELQLRQHYEVSPWQFHVRTDDAALTLIEALQIRAKFQAEQRALAQQAVVETTAIASLTESSPPELALVDSTTNRSHEQENAAHNGLEIGEMVDLIVEWPEGQKLRLVSSDGPVSWRVEIDDRKDWFGLTGTITLGGEAIPLGLLLSGLKSGRQFISIGAGKFARIADELRKRLKLLDDVVHHSKNGLEVDFTAAPVLDDFFDDKVTLKACRQWRDLSKNLSQATELNPELPPQLTATLRHYQVDGYRWMKRLAHWGVGACLADDMGVGKTVQALAMLIDRQETGPALVVAPKSVGFNWQRECEKFAPTLKPILFRDTDRDEVLKTLKPGDVVIVSYAMFQRDVEKFQPVKWGTLVLDEAQVVKNSQTQTAQAVRQIEAGWKLALTGTPIENHLGELWSLFRAISPGLFGSWERFKDKFASPIEKLHDQERQNALARVVRPFVLRRTKADVLRELPQRTEVLRTCELTPKERKIYEDVRLAAVMQLSGLLAGATSKKDDPRFQVLAALTRLRQLACHPALVDEKWKGSSSKLDLLLEIVEELREGEHRALVFSQFTSHLSLIRKALDKLGVKYLYLDGKTPAKARQQRVDAFQEGEGELFLISLKAGGTGLNLTAADYVIHMDPWWNPAVEDQASDRIHRIGQTKPVTIIRLVTKETIEEQILSLHADKRNLVSGVLDGTDKAAKLSTTELVDLIKSGGQVGAKATADLAPPKRGPGRPKISVGAKPKP